MENSEKFQMFEKELLSYDPIVVVLDVVRRWFFVIVASVLIGVCAYIVRDMSYTPVYQSQATLVVTTRGSSSTVYTNLTSTTDLAAVFTEILNSSLMKKSIAQELGMKSFEGTITASAVKDTNLLNVKVQSGDPRTTFLVIQAIINQHDIITEDVMGNIIVEVLLHPKVPTAPVNQPGSGSMMKRFTLISVV